MAYLDHAATTPMLPEAIEAMAAEMHRTGNPSSLHAAGRRARRVVEESRERLADAFSARPSEIVLTGGRHRGRQPGRQGPVLVAPRRRPRRARLLVGAAEHHAVLDPAAWLGDHEGAVVELLPVDDLGRVHPGAVAAAIERNPADVALISVMWANNEIGTVQPLSEIVELAHEHGIPVHSDAVQAAGQLPVDFAASGLDAMTLTGHKLGGPFGVGALVLGRGLTPTPLLHGGGQERDVRSGTLDAPAVLAFSVAAERATLEREGRAERIARLRDRLVREVQDSVPDAWLNGDPHSAGRLPGNAHFSFPGCEGDALLMLLDAAGVECSTGSACTAGVAQPSHVLLAAGADAERARGSLRFSLGHTSTDADVDALVAALGPAVERARRAGLAVRSG